MSSNKTWLEIRVKDKVQKKTKNYSQKNEGKESYLLLPLFFRAVTVYL
jgi:hypothetical protein